MLRRGKSEGWLSLPSTSFTQWADLNDVSFTHIEPGTVAGKGAALVASSDLRNPDSHTQQLLTLMTVPKDLILGYERIQEHAKADADFRDVLDRLGEFGTSPGVAIRVFLLFQASMLCPEFDGRFGLHSAFNDYIRSLPTEPLPTFWTSSELRLLVGTTLAPAVTSKLKNLNREFETLTTSIADTKWYRTMGEYLTLDDWLHVDAMYRSRALELPGIGPCMVPCVDLANHASLDSAVAIYEKDINGNAVLLLCQGKTAVQGDEVTITYGHEKGACEMLYSYGFIEHGVQSAEALLLSLSIPEGPQMSAKLQFADCAPGFKILDLGDGRVDWEGDYVWLLCVDEDDGLLFEMARTVDGSVELHALLNGLELTGGTSHLRSLLRAHDMWDVYHLRAVTILQQRAFEQMQVLYGSQEEIAAVRHGDGTAVRDSVFERTMSLRELEFDLLEKAYEQFENEKLCLAESPVVKKYLAEMNPESSPSEDSS